MVAEIAEIESIKRESWQHQKPTPLPQRGFKKRASSNPGQDGSCKRRWAAQLEENQLPEITASSQVDTDMIEGSSLPPPVAPDTDRQSRFIERSRGVMEMRWTTGRREGGFHFDGKGSDNDGRDDDEDGDEEDQYGDEEDQDGDEEDQNGDEEDKDGDEEDQNGDEEDQDGDEEDQDRDEEDQNGDEEDQDGDEEDQDGDEEDQDGDEEDQDRDQEDEEEDEEDEDKDPL